MTTAFMSVDPGTDTSAPVRMGRRSDVVGHVSTLTGIALGKEQIAAALCTMMSDADLKVRRQQSIDAVLQEYVQAETASRQNAVDEILLGYIEEENVTAFLLARRPVPRASAPIGRVSQPSNRSYWDLKAQ